ncbi:GntR family transcriptional regulator [Kribbella sp. DT2]|uniref:GntR family transcriptional regulator n=1 Tax=Kribbella sp. DT2 TaxID=3393427 RepID=UPI003CEE4229
MPAPYQQIAAGIRARISTGELGQGERVPSTRELMREYGVAMATATKALTTLQQEGLVHSRPGVGTVVGPARRTPVRADEPALSRDEVVRVAITLADAEGLAALSMRRIASELGVATMGLYRHVGGKDALVLQMVDRAIADFPFPPGEPADWRAGIETAARLQWAAYRRHLWLPGAISLGRPQMLPSLLSHTDAVLRAVSGFGVDPSTALYAAITVFGYVRGVALNLEPEALAEQDTGLTADQWADEHADRLAAVARGLAGFETLLDGFDFDFDLDQLFEFGLQLVLDGLGVRLETVRSRLR